jgi:hypothetical protein
MSTYLVHYANARHIAGANDRWNHERRTARPTRRNRSRLFSRNAED